MSIIVQQDAAIYSLLYFCKLLYMFRVVIPPVSGGNHTHHQERKQLYLQHLSLIKPTLLPFAVMEKLEAPTNLYPFSLIMRQKLGIRRSPLVISIIFRATANILDIQIYHVLQETLLSALNYIWKVT
jgi:hypothetical protein